MGLPDPPRGAPSAAEPEGVGASRELASVSHTLLLPSLAPVARLRAQLGSHAFSWGAVFRAQSLLGCTNDWVLSTFGCSEPQRVFPCGFECG